MIKIKTRAPIASVLALLALTLLGENAVFSSEIFACKNKSGFSSEESVPQSFCLQSTKAILDSVHWTQRDKAEVQSWLLTVQKLIANSSSFKRLQDEYSLELSNLRRTKAVYAFCIDSTGMPVGFHVLNRETFTPLDEKISAIVESAGPFPAAPNHLPWLQGGMRVELTLAREFKISIAPDWPNRRLAALSNNGM